MTDSRHPFRLIVDVLATAEQAQRLQPVIAKALCAAPEDHPGPCRIAWSMALVGGDPSQADGSYGLDTREAIFVQEQLAPVLVWPPEDVDRSLGL